jgi:hypothetical protein
MLAVAVANPRLAFVCLNEVAYVWKIDRDTKVGLVTDDHAKALYLRARLRTPIDMKFLNFDELALVKAVAPDDFTIIRDTENDHPAVRRIRKGAMLSRYVGPFACSSTRRRTATDFRLLPATGTLSRSNHQGSSRFGQRLMRASSMSRGLFRRQSTSRRCR